MGSDKSTVALGAELVVAVSKPNVPNGCADSFRGQTQSSHLTAAVDFAKFPRVEPSPCQFSASAATAEF